MLCGAKSCEPWWWAGWLGRKADGGSGSWLLLLGWSWECLQDWGPFFRLAIPSMLMLCIEWWAYEIGSFLVGTWGGGMWGAPSPGQVVHPPGLAPCQTVSFQQAGLGLALPSLGLAWSGHPGMIFGQR